MLTTLLLLLVLALLAIGGAELVRGQCRRMLSQPARAVPVPARTSTRTQRSVRYRDAA